MHQVTPDAFGRNTKALGHEGRVIREQDDIVTQPQKLPGQVKGVEATMDDDGDSQAHGRPSWIRSITVSRSRYVLAPPTTRRRAASANRDRSSELDRRVCSRRSMGLIPWK